MAGSRSRNMRPADGLGGSSGSGLDAMRTASPHKGARESFSLDIPSHRMSGLATIRPELEKETATRLNERVGLLAASEVTSY